MTPSMVSNWGFNIHLGHGELLSSAGRIVSTAPHGSQGVGTAAVSQPNLTKAAINSKRFSILLPGGCSRRAYFKVRLVFKPKAVLSAKR